MWWTYLANGHPSSDRDGYGYCSSNGNEHGYTNGNGYTNANGDGHPYANTDNYPYANNHANGDDNLNTFDHAASDHSISL